MAIRTLTLDDGEYLIYLDAVSDLPAAYYVGHIGINQPIYGRGEREDAIVYRKMEALHQIQSFLESGYPCHSEPPITIIY